MFLIKCMNELYKMNIKFIVNTCEYCENVVIQTLIGWKQHSAEKKEAIWPTDNAVFIKSSQICAEENNRAVYCLHADPFNA